MTKTLVISREELSEKKPKNYRVIRNGHKSDVYDTAPLQALLKFLKGL